MCIPKMLGINSLFLKLLHRFYPNTKLNIMSFYTEETISILQGSEKVYFLQDKALHEIKCFRSLQEGQLFLPSKTRDIGCFLIILVCYAIVKFHHFVKCEDNFENISYEKS